MTDLECAVKCIVMALAFGYVFYWGVWALAEIGKALDGNHEPEFKNKK